LSLRRRAQQHGSNPELDRSHCAIAHQPRRNLGFRRRIGRRLAASGAWGHITPHVNAVYERSTGFERTWAGFAGVEYQITERIAVDFTGQRYGLASGSPDRQLVIGLTMNFGKLQ
jgi:hypothetical protein